MDRVTRLLIKCLSIVEIHGIEKVNALLTPIAIVMGRRRRRHQYSKSGSLTRRGAILGLGGIAMGVGVFSSAHLIKL